MIEYSEISWFFKLFLNFCHSSIKRSDQCRCFISPVVFLSSIVSVMLFFMTRWEFLIFILVDCYPENPGERDTKKLRRQVLK